ncbi:FHA domain-containing protein [Anaeromyxobacter terrae]|uniref:FHA domain-containing protein n=1 Tax=Anaeromyxobacter terrae TaxID=2925406 RepID=UPI001F57CBDC|nr:FHA domain-containing protein [Anaeromyxobacter sp. SG22]
MKSFLLSWLTRKYSGGDLASFQRERPEDWLVWEAGPWRPPAAGRETMLAGPGTRLVAAGESLVIALAAKNGGPEVRVGRDPENDVVVDDGTLSRRHLVLRRDGGGGWTVEDAGSSNGTRVNGLRIGRAPLRLEPGARVEAGAVRLTFYDGPTLYLRLRGAA